MKESKGRFKWEQVSTLKLMNEVGKAYKRGKVEVLLEEGYKCSDISKRLDISESAVRQISKQLKD